MDRENLMLEIVYLPPHDLTPYGNNTRKHSLVDINEIKASIAADGFNDPIGIWGDKNIIVEGHGRQIAAMELGMEKVPCIRLDHLTDTQRRDYAIRHNRTAELSGWDFDKLQAEISALELEGVDLGGLNFDLSAITGEDSAEAIVEDDPPEAPEAPVSKLGDIWQLGKHRLMCGDSTDAGQIDKLLNGTFVRMTVTSPPYGVGKDYEEKGIDPWKKTISGVINAIKGKTLIVCWNIIDLFSTGTQFSEPTGAYSIQLFAEAGYGMLYNRIWKKPGANLGSNNPYYTVTTKSAQDYEYLYAFAEINAEKHLEGIKQYLFGEAKKAKIDDAVVSSIGGPKYMCNHWFTNNQWAFIDGDNYNRLQSYCKSKNIFAFERDYCELKREYLNNTIFSHTLSENDFSEWGLYGVWEFSTVHERLGGHAAAYPVELPARYIKMHSYEGNAVLDPFGGTGTTLIACEQLNRVCYMMELDPHYCDVIIQRWENLTKGKAILLNG